MEKMEIKSIIEMFDMVWPILVAIISFIFVKFIPYVRTRIIKVIIHNLEEALFLLEYELLGIALGAIFALAATLIWGKSTWNCIYLYEYGIFLLVFMLPYVLGISLIVKFKMEKKFQKYWQNIFLGSCVYVFMLLPLYASLFVSYDKISINLILSSIALLFLQIILNIEIEKIKNVEYIVYTDDEEEFDSKSEPVRSGNYFWVKLTDKNRKEIKRIQIPEDKIVKIEYCIEDIEKDE